MIVLSIPIGLASTKGKRARERAKVRPRARGKTKAWHSLSVLQAAWSLLRASSADVWVDMLGGFFYSSLVVIFALMVLSYSSVGWYLWSSLFVILALMTSPSSYL